MIDKGGEFAHGFTYSGHPAACAVASVNLALLQQENLVTRTRDETGPYLAKMWRELSEHPLVGEARCVGLIGALELVRDKATRRFFDNRGEVGTICRDYCFQNGLIMRAVRDTMIVSPPLVINREQLDELAAKAWQLPRPDARALPSGRPVLVRPGRPGHGRIDGRDRTIRGRAGGRVRRAVAASPAL